MRRPTILAAALLLIAAPAAAQDGIPGNAGTTPDSMLYGFDRGLETLELALTFSRQGKARLALEQAEERLAEAWAMRQRNRTALAGGAADGYAGALATAGRYARDLPDAERRRFMSRVSNRTADHARALERRRVDPDDAVYGAKLTAEDIAVTAAVRPIERARKQAMAASHRLNETERLVEAGRDDRVDNLLGDYQQEERELARIARNVTGPEERRVNEVVARATQRHVGTLERLRDRIPADAADALDVALTRSRSGHQAAVSALERTGGIPAGIDRRPGGSGSGPG